MEIDLTEYRVLSILRDRFNFLKFAHFISRDLFESEPTRVVYDIISKFHRENEVEIITISALRVLITTTIKVNDQSQFRGIVRRIRKAQTTDPAVVDQVVKSFAKRQLLKISVLEAVNALDAGEEADLERVREKLDAAIGIDSKNNVDDSYDYMHDPYTRIKIEEDEVKVATKISLELDQALGGGLAAGEIGLIIAPTGVGKTLTLVNIAYGALLQALGVVYATLEISPRKLARRLDSRIAGIPYSELTKDPEILNRKLSKLRKVGAKLHVKDYTASLCSVLDIRAYIERLIAKGFPLGVLIVDHADLMYSTNHYKEHRHELSSVVAGLRRLGAEFGVPVWTASQANRKALESGRTRLSDIAEDIGKANWSDVAIALSQTEVEKEDGLMFMQVVKTRMSKSNIKVPVIVDYDCMKMKGKANPADCNLKRKLRDG